MDTRNNYESPENDNVRKLFSTVTNKQLITVGKIHLNNDTTKKKYI